MTWLSPVLKVGAPVRSGDGDGNVRGSGQWRLLLSAVRYRVFREDPLALGLSLTRANGYNPVLASQGYRRWSLTLSLLTHRIGFCADWRDDHDTP